MTSEGKRKRVGVAIFGLGRAGQIHLGNLVRLRKAHLKYVVESDLSHGRSVAEKHLVDEDVKIIGPDSADEVFGDPGVGAIVVCTPTDTHQELVRRGLTSGKAVFCEKPIARTIEESESCYDDAEKNGIPLFCAFNRRFDPSVSLMRERYRQGDVGAAQSFKTCSRDSPRVPKSYLEISGGVFHDCAVHDLDMICWILGEYPTSVFTQAHAFRPEVADLDDVDQVMIVMKFRSGCVASIDLNRHAVYGYDQRAEIFGPKGMLEQQNRCPDTVVRHFDSGVASKRIDHSFPQRYREAYELEMTHFLNVVLGIEKELLVTREETSQVSRLASACEESYQTGKQIFMDSYDGKN